jgi:hypothetical protein
MFRVFLFSWLPPLKEAPLVLLTVCFLSWAKRVFVETLEYMLAQNPPAAPARRQAAQSGTPRPVYTGQRNFRGIS